MKKFQVNWKYILALVLIPVVITLVLFAIAGIQGATRYNPAYFTAEYKERYAVPSTVVYDLEDAIQMGDAIRLAQLEGTRRVMKNMQPNPDVSFEIFWDEEGKYLNYLFFDYSNYNRIIKHVKEVNGRYISVPDGIFHLVDSGRWRRFMMPITLIWWLVMALFAAGLWIYRVMAVERKKMYG